MEFYYLVLTLMFGYLYYEKLFIIFHSIVERPYKKHINTDNPLGTGGALVELFGDLLEEICNGRSSFLSSDQLQSMIGKHITLHSDFQVYDHELLSFILDRLHEDLNLVKKRPFVNTVIETIGRYDKVAISVK